MKVLTNAAHMLVVIHVHCKLVQPLGMHLQLMKY